VDLNSRGERTGAPPNLSSAPRLPLQAMALTRLHSAVAHGILHDREMISTSAEQQQLMRTHQQTPPSSELGSSPCRVAECQHAVGGRRRLHIHEGTLVDGDSFVCAVEEKRFEIGHAWGRVGAGGDQARELKATAE
jgi:hypothetical protein